MSTIDITPVVNDEAVRAYAERHKTSAPWEHIAGRLRELDELSRWIENNLDLEEPPSDVDGLVRRVHSAHRAATNEFLDMFGRRP